MPKRSEKRDTAKAEYIAKKKKGEEVSLRALAGELGVSYQTLRNWKAADKWEEALPKKKRGGQPGNQDMAPTAVRFERWPGPFLLCGEVDKSATDRYF